MKSLRLHGTGDLRIHDEPVPVAGEGERLERVRSMGGCGSDLHWFTEGAIGNAKLERLFVLGMSLQARQKTVSASRLTQRFPAGVVNSVNREFQIYVHP